MSSQTGCGGGAVSGTPPAASSPAHLPAIEQTAWGSVDDKPVSLFTLRNQNGLVVKIATYGGIITQLELPDRTGKPADVVLGFDNVQDYVKSSPYFGAIIGRVANRITDARFELEGKEYSLAANNGKNSLHGGTKGWDKVVWDAVPRETPDGPALELSYTSKDGEEGFPGTVSAKNTYTLTRNNELKIEMSATSDRTTIVNMTHHTYWNLAGHSSGPVLDQELTIHAQSYTPADPVTLSVSGEVKSVKGTPFDFTSPKPIGRDLRAAGGTPVGFDANWIVDGDAHQLREVARLKDPKSGRVLTLRADQPGVQFYSGNFLDGSIVGKGGVHYPQYSAVCLESQKFPNSVNVPAWQAEVVLRPGQVYKNTMIFAFSNE